MGLVPNASRSGLFRLSGVDGSSSFKQAHSARSCPVKRWWYYININARDVGVDARCPTAMLRLASYVAERGTPEGFSRARRVLERRLWWVLVKRSVARPVELGRLR